MTPRRFFQGVLRRKHVIVLLGATLACGLTAGSGCTPNTGSNGSTGSSGNTGNSSNSDGGAGSSKKLVIEGSDTLLELSQKWAEEYQKKNPDIELTVTGGGSGQGITSLINGTADIANASREASDKEKAQAKEKGFDMVETAVARDGITIVVNPSNTVKSLTLEQVAGIYTGKIKNWSEVGGPNVPVSASGRDTSSGTYKYFQEDILKNEKYRADMKSTPSNNAIAQNVGNEPGGVGYIGVAYANEFTKAGKVKEVPISFKAGETPVMPTPENILGGKYPISRALYNYTRNTPDGQVKAYLDFATGPDGQKIVEQIGFVTLNGPGGENSASATEAAAAPASPGPGASKK